MQKHTIGAENTMETPQIQKNDDVASAARWNSLLDQLSVDKLTDLFIERVLQLDDYRDGVLPASEIRRTGAASFEALIESLRPGADSKRLIAERQGISLDVGVSRARTGIPVESLMTAIRIDFTVIWGELMALADPGDAELLVRRAETVWQVVDSYAAQTQAIYIAERQRMAQEESSVRQGHVATMFGQVSPASEMLTLIAAELGIDQFAPLVVAAATTDDAAALRVEVASASRRGTEMFTHPLPDGLVAFWAADDRPGSAAREATEQIKNIRCGLVEQVRGLTDLRVAAQTARALASLVEDRDQQALTMQNDWARLARHRLSETGVPIVPDVDAALARCGPVERARLVEAVRSYLTTGSIAQSAEQLFCHRNTLMNRLRRFTELVGIDVTIPQQAARLVVAWS
ncbi:helix-turn-helix domain-containing protein [Arthrobacter sulfonylureivorans]|uniref:Helix-turn-helix domain-containing protein n=1 Tax=Arthrobacter sulfonylureivorans TaxID=2486855 RepID=A0ABY3WA53_9MICC|nr:helix-turn-helix domain-containing protein [Arthrobacter sulfonylureivorans]UNK45196.1 helix-turn-helix domain-containing protein [Arthrobacter sulfonylureivorans]